MAGMDNEPHDEHLRLVSESAIEDQVHLVRLVARDMNMQRVRYQRYMLSAFLVAAGIYLISGPQPMPQRLAGPVTVLVLGLIGLPLWDRSHAEKRMLTVVSRSWSGPEHWEIDLLPDRIRFRVSETETTIPWSHFQSVEEDEDYVVLRTPRCAHTVLPNRAFGSREHQERFTGYLRERIAPTG
jgi:hypothetical protein